MGDFFQDSSKSVSKESSFEPWPREFTIRKRFPLDLAHQWCFWSHLKNHIPLVCLPIGILSRTQRAILTTRLIREEFAWIQIYGTEFCDEGAMESQLSWDSWVHLLVFRFLLSLGFFLLIMHHFCTLRISLSSLNEEACFHLKIANIQSFGIIQEVSL